jgi:primosomal replication protein N
MSRNVVSLSGEFTAIDALRFTPAGIAAVDFRILHRSSQTEANFRRDITCEVQGVAMAGTAQRIARLQVGRHAEFTGFLAQRSRRSTQLMLHVNEFQLIEDTDHAQTNRQG